MTFGMTLTGMKELRRALQQMPEAMRVRVVVPVITKGVQTMGATIAPLIPRQSKSKMRRNGLGRLRGGLHYRDVLTSVVRQYENSDTVVGVVGAESGKAPHSILVEKGTRPRFTNSKPKYQRIATGIKTVIKDGRIFTKSVRQKQSIGSVIRRKNKPQHYRGVMPAFRPMERGVESCSSTVSSQMAAGVRAGITRELTAANLARGNP